MANIANIKPSERWTAAEEAQLQALAERRARIHSDTIGPLTTYLSDNLTHPVATNANRLAEWLAADAQTIRDLLQPFDLRLTQDQEGDK